MEPKSILLAEPKKLEIRSELCITTAAEIAVDKQKRNLLIDELQSAKKKIAEKSDKFALMELVQSYLKKLILVSPATLKHAAEESELRIFVKDWPTYLKCAGYFVPPDYCFNKEYLKQLFEGTKLLVTKISFLSFFFNIFIISKDSEV